MKAKNRFTKAVEKAAENTENNIQSESDNPAGIVPESIPENTRENTAQNRRENILQKILETGKKNKGGSHTLYLSADVGDALAKYAKKTKRSKSVLVNEILREVLINRG